MPGEDVRITWEIGRLLICSLLRVSSRALACGEQKNATVYRVDLALIIAKGLATYLRFIEYIICVLSTQVSFFNFSLKLSFNLSDVMFFPETL